MSRLKYKELYFHAEEQRRRLDGELKDARQVLKILSLLGEPVMARLLREQDESLDCHNLRRHCVNHQEYELLKLWMDPDFRIGGWTAVKVRGVPVVWR